MSLMEVLRERCAALDISKMRRQGGCSGAEPAPQGRQVAEVSGRHQWSDALAQPAKTVRLGRLQSVVEYVTPTPTRR